MAKNEEIFSDVLANEECDIKCEYSTVKREETCIENKVREWEILKGTDVLFSWTLCLKIYKEHNRSKVSGKSV